MNFFDENCRNFVLIGFSQEDLIVSKARQLIAKMLKSKTIELGKCIFVY